MKKRKGFLTLSVVGLMAMLLSLPGVVLGGGPNSGLEAEEKLIGPLLRGVVIVGWKDNGTGDDLGTAEALLLVEGKLYVQIIDMEMPSNSFLAATAASLPIYPLPSQVAVDYGMVDGSRAVIFEEKDVSNCNVEADVSGEDPYGNTVPIAYNHLFHCDVKISFIVPKNKK